MLKNTSTFEDRISKLELSVIGMKLSIDKICVQSSRHQALLMRIDEHKANAVLDALYDRINEISNRLQLELLKITVCSEVTRFDKDLWPKIITALDYKDSWWKDGNNLTIKEWAKRLKKEVPSVNLHKKININQSNRPKPASRPMK